MEIRKLSQEEHNKVRPLYEKVFTEDSKGFVDYYFWEKTRDNDIYVVEEDGEIFPFLDHAYALVDASVKRYMERGFSNLSVFFGCTGGQHRSVYSAQHMAEHLNKKFGVKVELVHREQNIEQTFERTL